MVPKGWEHPKDFRGHHRPLYDQPYEEAAAQWLANFRKWESGEDPNREKADTPYFWDWDGMPPDKKYYRPSWTLEEASCFQIYETVSEGTPISPVFETKEEMLGWLVKEGYSEKAAVCFVRDGWVPSMAFVPGEGLIRDIETARLAGNCSE